MKRIVAFLVTLSLLLCMLPATFAASSSSVAKTAANRLYDLGLMKGTGTNADGSPDFDLEEDLTREQAVVMLLRLLGKEEEANAAGMKMPFTDVSGWAANCVAYAYNTGLVNGTGTTTFHGKREISAAEYITLVLRVLGYSSETDFVWKSPWVLSNAIGLTKGEYSSATTRFLRGDMAIVSANALDVTLKDGSKTLLAQIGLSNVPSERPSKEEYIERIMTDARLAALKTASLTTLQNEISTIGDAVKFLDQFTPHAFSGFSGEIRLDLDFVYPLHTSPEATTPQTYAAFAAWCLADDYDGIQYVICTGENHSSLRISVALALPVEDGYYLYTPYETSTLIDDDLCFSAEVLSLKNLEDVLEFPWTTPKPLQIFVADAKQRTLKFTTNEDTMVANVSQGSAKTVYTISDEAKAEMEEAKKQQRIETGWNNLQNNWNRFGFPVSFAPTLSKTQVEELIGKDIDTVSAALKTFGDVMYYFALGGYEVGNGDFDVSDGKHNWTFNQGPQTVFNANEGNCGGTSGIVARLLQGDYDEVGILTMTSSVEMGGGHVINYIKDGDSCYVFDSLAPCIMEFRDLGAPFCTGTDIVSAGLVWQRQTNNDFRLIFAYPSSDGDMPHMGAGKTVYLPTNYRSQITIVYEDTAEGYKYEWRTIGTDILKEINGIRNPISSRPGNDVVIDTSENYLTRVLTDEQLSELKYADKKTLQAWISTAADAVAYLDQFNYPLFDALGDGFEMDIDFMLNLHRTEATAPSTYTAFTGWCLADDYPETNYLIASVKNADNAWVYHSLLLPNGNGYRIINPAEHSQRGNSIYGFHEEYVSSTTNLSNILSPRNGNMAGDSDLFIYNLFVAPAGQDNMNFLFNGNYLVSISGKELYRITDAELDAITAAEQAAWNEIAKTLDVSNYGIPSAIGATTLTYQKAYALVGQDPAEIAKQVKTVGDVLQYMIAARFSYNAPSAYTPWYGYWGFDAPGDVQLEQNFGCCCGGFANTVSYLLQGDYDKVGTLRWIGGGNHTISWVYTGGTYYIFDFTQFCSGGRFDNFNAPVTVLTDLADYYNKLPPCYPKSEIVLMVAFEAGEAMYPSHWEDYPHFTELVFPTEAKEKILTIYQRDDEYGVNYKNVTTLIPGWTD